MEDSMHTEMDTRPIRGLIFSKMLAWPLKPVEKCWYIGSRSRAIKESIRYPSGPTQ